MYAAGDGIEKDNALSREFWICWAASNAATARRHAEKTARVFLWHRPGEEPLHRLWTERTNYFVEYEALIRRRRENTEPMSIDTAEALRKLPDGCRPARPPAAEMRAANVNRVEGSVVLLSDKSGRITGMVVSKLSEPRILIGAFDAFQKALRADGCLVPTDAADRPIEVPFTFQLE